MDTRPSDLPIDAVLPELIAAVKARGCAVLQAPPGAGKTSRVPLALLETVEARIVMLEPRRLAARAAAMRLAEQLGEPLGATVGLRMRGESIAGGRIEVVTEGILTAMIQSDPELSGVGCVIFDEFHERSLNADLGLALTLELRAALRPDLALVVMSATLDAAPVAALMGDAPVVTAQGRSYPVDIRWLDRPLPPRARLEPEVAAVIRQAVLETSGSVLVFLPGAGEIRRVEAALGKIEDCEIRPLYGALPFKKQRAAIAPSQTRKIVLSTSIAETSLTIEGIEVVVDAGRARRARFDPASGMSALVTEPVSRAEATQRAGRAGRLSPGVCYRLWKQAQEGALPSFAPPEIASADLAGLALELARWGADAADLAFLTPPPEAGLARARAALEALGALQDGRITAHGRAMARLPLHPRLSHMLLVAGKQASPLAALLSERDPARTRETDVTLRLRAIAAGDPAYRAISALAKRLSKLVETAPKLSSGAMAALAYPDRVGKRRPGGDPRYILSGGKGASLDAADGLAAAPLIVAMTLIGDTREPAVRLAARIEEAELRGVLGSDIEHVETCAWSRRDGRVIAVRQERLGAVVLSESRWDEAPAEAVGAAMLEGVRQLGLSFSPETERFRVRVARAREVEPDLPDMSDAALQETLEQWLAPWVGTLTTAADWSAFDAGPALRAMLDHRQMQAVDRAVPKFFTTPLGRKIAIDYSGEAPSIALKLQEMFGVTRHPSVAGRPLQVTLLSPAGRPVQVTMDIPGFWDSSYADVRRDLRGRYPRHPWPENPREADPTQRAKPRGS